MHRVHCLFVVVGLALLSFTGVHSAAQNQSAKPLTIEAIAAPGGLTGRAPENFQWSPDSARLSFVQRDDTGEHGELWYIDSSSGEKKLLVSEARPDRRGSSGAINARYSRGVRARSAGHSRLDSRRAIAAQ